MKIAFDARELTRERLPAGIGYYIRALFTALAEMDRQMRLTAFCSGSESPFRAGLEIETLDLAERYFGKWSQTAWEYLFWGKQIDRLGTDGFHSTAHLVPGGMRTPLVLTVHDLTSFLFPQWYRWSNQRNRSWHLRRGIKEARRIIAVSQSTRRDLDRLFPEAEGKVEVVYEGVDSIFAPQGPVEREQLGLTFSEPFILWVGTTSPRKNLLGLLRAFERVHRRAPEVRLVLVGQRGWKDQAVFDFIRERGLARMVHTPGYQPREKLPGFYSSCAAFVLPSLYEGFGLPVLEAMSCGAPVLASNTSSLPEIAPDESALFDPRRPEEIAEKILWLLQDDSVRRRLSATGLERAKAFSWPRAAQETREVYHKALG